MASGSNGDSNVVCRGGCAHHHRLPDQNQYNLFPSMDGDVVGYWVDLFIGISFQLL